MKFLMNSKDEIRSFAGSRKNMNEFAACGLACKTIRKGLTQLLPDQTNSHFSGRLIRLIKMINLHDIEGGRGKRSIIFSSAKPLLMNLMFNLLQPLADLKSNFFTATHPVYKPPTPKLIQRLTAPTLKFFKTVRTIGLMIGPIGAGILASPLVLPAVVVLVGGYLALAGGIIYFHWAKNHPLAKNRRYAYAELLQYSPSTSHPSLLRILDDDL